MTSHACLGKTGHGKSWFMKWAIVCNYQFSIYVNPKMEEVPDHEGLWYWVNDINSVLQYKKIVVPAANEKFFDFLRDLRQYIPMQYPICVVLDELHHYDNKELQKLPTTAKSLNIDVYALFQSITSVKNIYISQSQKIIFFYVDDLELNTLRGSVYCMDLPVDKFRILWSDNDFQNDILSKRFAIYNGYMWEWFPTYGDPNDVLPPELFAVDRGPEADVDGSPGPEDLQDVMPDGVQEETPKEETEETAPEA